MISYGSVCSGIEAATVAWSPLGFKAAWFSEIDPFPAAVLAYRWPHVINLGDMTKIAELVRSGLISAPDILVGGTPCQAFSVAGLRKGLSDGRGQLTIAYGELADAIDEVRCAEGEPPAIIVWENVPGVLSSKDNAFGAFLGLLAGEDCELQPAGRKWTNAGVVFGPKRAIAWRVLNAQYFGVAQRRKRVFVIASARIGFDPRKVLFEFEGVRRDIAPGRGSREVVAALTATGVGTCGADDNQGQAGHLIPQCVTGHIAHTLKAEGFDGSEDGTGRGVPIICMATGQSSAEVTTADIAPTVTCNHESPIVAGHFSSTGAGYWSEGFGTLRARPQESHEHLAVISVHGTQDPDINEDLAHTLGRNGGQENAVCYAIQDCTGRQKAQGGKGWNDNGAAYTLDTHATQGVVYAFQPRIGRNGRGDMGDIIHSLNAQAGETGKGDAAPCVAIAFQERGRAEGRTLEINGDLSYALTAPSGGGRAHERNIADFRTMSVRRLTPVECERLQGFPDNHTLIPAKMCKKITADEFAYLRQHIPGITAEEAYRKAADGPRYKAIGNSMAVPCMQWIGERIINELENEI